jgi:hypothetical protein
MYFQMPFPYYSIILTPIILPHTKVAIFSIKNLSLIISYHVTYILKLLFF